MLTLVDLILRITNYKIFGDIGGKPPAVLIRKFFKCLKTFYKFKLQIFPLNTRYFIV